MKEFRCKKCNSKDLFIRKNGNNTGLYCSDCGSWIKWLGKAEIQLAERFIASYNFNKSVNGEENELFFIGVDLIKELNKVYKNIMEFKESEGLSIKEKKLCNCIFEDMINTYSNFLEVVEDNCDFVINTNDEIPTEHDIEELKIMRDKK